MTRKALELECQALDIPFRVAFRHASAERARTAAILVSARDAHGTTGHGEGCPREYVTGESVAGALRFFAEHREAWCRELRDTAALRDWARRNRALVDANPAAWCALELALLDLFGRQNRRSLEAELGLPELTGEFAYTAVLGDADAQTFDAQLARYLQLGFAGFKVKLSGELGRDRERMQVFAARTAGRARVRADANNLWRAADDAIAHVNAIGTRFDALEEPLAAGDYAGLAQVAAALELPIIVDESCTRAAHLEALTGAPPERWIVNLRVSKMGGLVRALEVLEGVRTAGMRAVVGAQVGETSLLSRAALAAAHAGRDVLIAQEGAFGTLLLERDLCEPPVMFGARGVLADAGARFAGQPGTGLAVRVGALS